MTKVIAIGADHAGFAYKQALIDMGEKLGYIMLDCGTKDETSVDYPDYAQKVAKIVSQNKDQQGILICGSGIGMSIAANRYSGIRGALCHCGLAAQLSRAHNDANILIIGSRLIDLDIAKECFHIFTNTKFEGGRHTERIKKIDDFYIES